MNSLAEDGWRVVAVSPNIAMGYGIFITFEKETKEQVWLKELQISMVVAQARSKLMEEEIKPLKISMEESLDIMTKV